MTDDTRVVLDTNVLISGLFAIKNSPSSKILDAIRKQRIILVISPAIVEEIAEVLNRDRVVKRTKMSIKERSEFVDMLVERSDVTEGKQMRQIVSRDIKDDKFLACAVEAKADYIITGDKDLLILKKYEGIQILTPREFLENMPLR